MVFLKLSPDMVSNLGSLPAKGDWDESAMGGVCAARDGRCPCWVRRDDLIFAPSVQPDGLILDVSDLLRIPELTSVGVRRPLEEKARKACSLYWRLLIL